MPSTTLANGALGIDVASVAAGTTISTNTVDLTGGTGNDFGIVVSFDYGAVTVSDNIVTGAGSDDGILLYQDAGTVAVSGNTINGTSSGTGILVTAQNSDTSLFGDVPGAVAATLTNNTVSGFATGVEVVSDGSVGDTASANIGDGTSPNVNSTSGASYGIVVSGDGASADINDNSIGGSVTAGIYVSGGSATISGNGITGGGDGIDAGSLSGSYPVLTITGNTISGGSGHGMNLQDLGDGSVIGGSLLVDGNSVTIAGGGTGIQTGFAQGSLTIENNDVNATGTAAIGIDAVATSGTLTIDDNTVSGTSVSIDVNQSQGATTVSGNIVTNSGDGDGIVVFNTATAAAVSGNTLTSSSSAPSVGDAAGIEISSAGSDVSKADLTGNSITGYYTGVQVDSSAGGTASATIGGSSVGNSNTISGANTGILLNGAGSSATILDNNSTIENSTIGIDIEGGTATIDGNVFSGNGTDVKIGASGAVTSLTDNAFSGTQFIDNLAAGNLDATTDSFNVGSSNAPVAGNSLTPAEGFAVEDRITDYLDHPADGYVKLNSNNVYVTALSESDTADAIQRGITVAAPGNTVNVQAGTYVDQVQIGKAITLTGAGNSTIIDSPATLPSSFTTGGVTYFPVVLVQGADATVENLEINGGGYGNANNRLAGLAFYNAGGSAAGLTVTGTEDTPLDGVQAGYGIIARSDDSAVRGLSISDNTVEDYQKNGIDVRGNGTTATISGNTVTGSDVTGVIGQNGIVIGFGAAATISGNTIDGNQYGGSDPDSYSAGVLIYDAAAGTQVTSNTIGTHVGNDVGVELESNISAVQYSIHGNTIANSTRAGIYLKRNVGGTTVTNNLLTSNAVGVGIDSTATNVGAINSNSFDPSPVGIENDSSQASIDATGNWWNSVNGPTSPNNTWPGTPKGESVTGSGAANVIVTPWLTDGTNSVSPPTPGFYPAFAVDSVSTAISDGGSGTVGDSVYDTAVLTVTGPTPTGTVTYTFTGAELASLVPLAGWSAVTTTEWQDTVNLNLNGTVPNSAPTGALLAGSDYVFSAQYSGDTHYQQSTPSASEPLTIGQGSTSVSTLTMDTGNGLVGDSTVYDTATIHFTPGTSFAEGGTVTYTFTGAELASLTPASGWTAFNSTTWTETVTVVAGSAPNSDPVGALPAGTDYAFTAQYSGDSDYTASAPSVSEPLTIGKGTTSVSTVIVDGGSGLVGDSTVYDTATIHFTPGTSFAEGGTVTYTFTGAELASLTPAAGWSAVTTTEWQETVNVTSGSVPNSAPVGALPAGTDYAFGAQYSGDSDYTASAPSASEPLTIGKGSTSVSTLTMDTGNGLVGDSTVYDTATIHFTPGTSFAEGGTVTYTFTGAELAALTPASGWSAFNSTTWTETVTVTAGSAPNSTPVGALPAGTDYAFTAQYSGDSDYTVSAPSASEPLTIGKGSTSVSTLTMDTGNGLVGDSTVYDTATIHFTPGTSFAEGGTVTYTFTGAELAALTPASGWSAFNSTTWMETVTVTAGSAPNSTPVGALPAGTDYAFTAQYSGDSDYTASALLLRSR